jgi:tetratricopeptide (TPR) repeat protein
MTSKPVFISYSHDSEEHRKWVLGLSERLRQDGIPAEIDQYVRGTPAAGWPRWMLNQLDAAAFVLVICTETYYRRFRGHEVPGRGKGVDWEGALITQETYDERSESLKFVPVLRAAEDERFVPQPLRRHTRYVLTSEDAYCSLRDFLLGQAGVEPGVVGVPDLRGRKRGIPLRFDGAPAAALSRRPIHLPYPSLGDLFKGRDAVLDGLRASLENASVEAGKISVRVLHGLGGVGKTRAAVEYARRYTESYSGIFFVDAESAASIGRNLAGLAGPLVLNLPEQDAPEEEAHQAAVLSWLSEHPTWLLILDNVDSREAAAAAQDVLARLAGGHVLLTGRISEWNPTLEPTELGLLDLDTATDFLLARTAGRRRKASDDPTNARALAKRLEGLPLALEQAGAYIAHRRLTFGEYFAAWEAQRETVLAWSDSRVMHYPKSLAVTWQTSITQLTVGGRRLLQRLAWLAAEPIPESLLDVPVMGDKGVDVREALADLACYSLVTRATGEPTFTVHRLVQEVTRRETREDAARSSLEEALHWIDDAFVGDPQDVRVWSTLDPLTPHAREVAGHADATDVGGRTSYLLTRIGLLLKVKARYIEAEALQRHALVIAEKTLDSDHPELAIRLNNLAQLLQETNRLAEAEPLMRRALDIGERSLGPDHPKVATRLNNLAQLLQDTDRLAEAEPLMRRALDIDERSLGPDHPDVAIDLNNLAAMLQNTDRLAEAEPLARRALAIDERSFGPDHPAVARDLNNLAQLLKLTQGPVEAEPLMRRALAIDEQSFGPDHPEVATDLNNLALLLLDTDRLAEAETLMGRALAINKASFGGDHPKVAINLRNLAEIIETVGQTTEATALRQRAQEIEAGSRITRPS